MVDAAFPPPHACDCHVHVIGPKTRFPLAPMRRYTPKDATVRELAAMLGRLGLERVVLVQPSFYATDNACLVDAMTRLPAARGIAVLAPGSSPAALDALHERGVRGLRINIATSGTAPLETIKDEIATAAKLCARHGWHVQLFVAAAAIEPLAPVLKALPVDSVFDHFGLIAPDDVSGALRALQDLLASGKTWVKISAAYRISGDPNDPRIGPLARALCEANPERIVWGTDWPHTPRHHLHRGPRDEEIPFRPMNTRGLLNLLPRWLKDEALVQRVLVDNPAKLYDFS